MVVERVQARLALCVCAVPNTVSPSTQPDARRAVLCVRPSMTAASLLPRAADDDRPPSSLLPLPASLCSTHVIHSPSHADPHLLQAMCHVTVR